MGRYVIVPIYKDVLTRYTAPVVFSDEPDEVISSSGLSRFPEWSFHKTTVTYQRKSLAKVRPEFWDKDPQSNRSKKRAKRDFSGSRPERRQIRRLGEKMSGYAKGKGSEGKKPGAAKCW